MQILFFTEIAQMKSLFFVAFLQFTARITATEDRGSGGGRSLAARHNGRAGRKRRIFRAIRSRRSEKTGRQCGKGGAECGAVARKRKTEQPRLLRFGFFTYQITLTRIISSIASSLGMISSGTATPISTIV